MYNTIIVIVACRDIHNAIAKIESDEVGENQISMIYQKGFKIGDKIIRHAMVQVANCD